VDLFAPTHLFLLLLVILIIFGPSKLGDVGGALGKGIRDFKRAVNEPEGVPTLTDSVPLKKSRRRKDCDEPAINGTILSGTKD
jgi:TatA/E family protein of Tat protein translocase